MNFKTFVRALAVLLVVLATSVASAQDRYVVTQSPFWAQMNSINDGTARAFNGIRRAMGQPERVRQPLFDDRVIERVDARQYHGSYQTYAPQGAYYGEPRGGGVANAIGQLLGGGQQVPPQYQGMHPCDVPLQYRPRYGSDTPDCGATQATERAVVITGAANAVATVVDGILTRRAAKREGEKTRASMEEVSNSMAKVLEIQDIQEAPQQTPAPTRTSIPVQPRTVIEPQVRGEMVKVLNCTGSVLTITGKFAGEAWTLQPGESRVIETRSGLGLKANYSGRSGQIVVADANTIAVHPSSN